MIFKISQLQVFYSMLVSLYPEEMDEMRILRNWKENDLFPEYQRRGYNPLEIENELDYIYKLISGIEKVDGNLALKVFEDMKNKNYADYQNIIVTPERLLELDTMVDKANLMKTESDKFYKSLETLYAKVQGL